MITTASAARRILLSTLLLAGTVVVPARVALAQDMGIKVGATAPGAPVESLDGRAMDLSSVYGDRPVVIEFWATWCPLCRELEPTMQAARQRHAGAVTFISIGVRDNQTPERQRAYADKMKMGGQLVFDRSGSAAAAFGVPHTSYVVVLDRSRKVVYTGVGGKQDIEEALAKAALD